MKIAFIADVHVGNPKRLGGPMTAGINWRGSLILAALQRAVDQAVKEADLLVICGDLFDSAKPEPQLVAAVQKILEPMETVVLCGNHDRVSGAPGDHALGPLAPVATVIDQPTVLRLGDGSVELVCLPFAKEPTSEWLIPTLDKLVPDRGKPLESRELRLVAAHFGISDMLTAPWLRGAPDAIDSKLLQGLGGVDGVFAGNWHSSRDFGASVSQVGALVPTGWDNALPWPAKAPSPSPAVSLFGGYILFETVGVGHSWVATRSCISGPRFCILSFRGGRQLLADLEAARASDENVDPEQLFIRLVTLPGQLQDATDVVEDLGLARRVEIVVDSTDEVVAARRSATDACQAETLGAALDGYTKAMSLPASLSPGAVADRARQYLKV